MRSKCFSQFVEKIKKLKLSLSNQPNKMPKIRSETLITRKNGETIELGKKSPGNFPGNFSNSENREDFPVFCFLGS